MKNKAIVIGLTGGAGVGKSAAAEIFRQLGAKVVDADRIGHELVKPGSACFSKIVKAFGKSILKSGRIDRRTLGHIVFNDKKELARLNRIVHPYILRKIKDEILKINNENYRGIVVIDAALLVQWGWHKKVDCVVVVTAPLKQRLQRLTDKGRPLSEARRIIALQLGEEVFKNAADFVIENNEGLDELEDWVKDLYTMVTGYL
jgi:dephospho-CoA kinase